MGELTGLVRELVGEMRGFREELREVKKVVAHTFLSTSDSPITAFIYSLYFWFSHCHFYILSMMTSM